METPPIRPKTTKEPDNEKNRCAYITKKLVQFFISEKYKRLLKRLCQHYGCNYNAVHNYYKNCLHEQFGINHLISMLTPETEEEVLIKKIFRIFMKWFLKEKYLAYIMKHGKMGKKESYIDYKNKVLLYIENTDEQEQSQASK